MCDACERDRREMNRAHYWEGVRAGMRKFAYWADGDEFVGTAGTTLIDALAEVDAEEVQEKARRAR